MGKKMLSQQSIKALRGSGWIARLEVQSIGKTPTRAEITAALTKVVDGHFTLALKKQGLEEIYVSNILPIEALSWFRENCRAYKECSDPAGSLLCASVYWEELKPSLRPDYW